MPSAIEREAPAAVGEVVVEEQVHRPRADQHEPERDGAREARDGEDRDADRAGELLAPRARLEAGEVGEQRALDRLEELQRGARDQQHVEDEAGHGRVRRGHVDEQDGGVEQRLLGDHHGQHREREAPAARQAERVRVGLAAPARGGRRENAHGTTTSETNGAAAMPSATADWPSAIPTATASAKARRVIASRNTSPP